MSKRIYISPSNQVNNVYAYGNTNEMEQCNKIAQACETALKRCGFETKRAPKGQNMYTSISESNAFKADVHLCIHTNAGGGKGTEVFVYDKADKNMKYAQPVYNELVKVTGNGRGIKTANFTEITNTSAKCVYCECEFHDDSILAKWIVNKTNALGEAIAKGICSAFAVKYKTDSNLSSKTEDKKPVTAKFKSYIVRITSDSGVNIRKGAGTNYDVVGAIPKGGAYTIIAEKNGKGAKKWGKLKSGAGWIALDYTERI